MTIHVSQRMEEGDGDLGPTMVTELYHAPTGDTVKIYHDNPESIFFDGGDWTLEEVVPVATMMLMAAGIAQKMVDESKIIGG